MLNDLIFSSISEDKDIYTPARHKLMESLSIDDINLTYFLLLYQKLNNNNSKKLVISKTNTNLPEGAISFFGSTDDLKNLEERLNLTHYSSLLKNKDELSKKAKSAHIIRAPMHAGTGSSFSRKRYLSEIKKRPLKDISLGAKGGDLFINLPDPQNPEIKKPVSLIELQILKAIRDSQKETYKKISIRNIVGPETEKSVLEILCKPSLIDPKKTYNELFEKNPSLEFWDTLIQDKTPVLDDKDNFTTKFSAPSGHGFFAFEILKRMPEEPSLQNLKNTIYRISNGEDINACEDPIIIGHMIKNKIPIAIITTTRQETDSKGGTIGLASPKDENPYITIFEKAQAKEAEKIIPGQKEIFENLGLSGKSNKAFFNTNMALFNLEILSTKLKKLSERIGRKEFLKIISPDPFLSEKKRPCKEGKEKFYKQIEGVLSSSIFNLDKAYSEIFDSHLVTLINIDSKNRSKFFSPIKFPIDFIEKFLSKRFTLQSDYKLIDHNPGKLIKTKLLDNNSQNNFWNDLSNTLKALENADFLELEELTIIGRVIISNTCFKGKVFIKNKTTELFNLTKYIYKNPHLNIPIKDSIISLQNIRIEINSKNEICIKPL